jgi:hypothetical protein
MATTTQTYTIERPAAGAWVSVYSRDDTYIGRAEILRWVAPKDAIVRFIEFDNSMPYGSHGTRYQLGQEYGFTYRVPADDGQMPTFMLNRIDGKPGMETHTWTMEWDDDNPF